MVRRTPSVLLVLSLGTLSIPFFSPPAFAKPATLKCDANRDQVWVYDSLTNFNVDAKLKCGQAVEIIERVPNYVRIRAQNGVEGYVPDADIVDLPAFQLYHDVSHDVGLAAKRAQASEMTKAAADAVALVPPDVNYAKLPPPQNIAASSSASVAPAPAPALGAPKVAPTGQLASKPAPMALAAPEKLAVALPAQPTDSAVSTTRDSVLPAAMASNANAEDDSVGSDVSAQSSPCQTYFSAYGLTPNQTKWIAQNREKSFSTICPAPDPSKVDFVMIFTHDVDFFSGTMPDPVHKSGGFSDFTPMTPIDTALIPVSQADNAHREYVWIFQFQEGTFDPATFSPRRRYQFSKMETSSLGSKGSVKTIEDAFRFVVSASH